MSLDDLKNRLNDLALQLKKLREIGLLDAEGIKQFDTESLDQVEKSKLEIMNLYVRDSERKLSVFDNISSRIQVLLEGLNSKFKNKNIRLSKERGLIAIGPHDLDLALDELSSGEQHEIVLLYELLFKVTPNTLVLIDEPELSLHMTWQKSFLPELLSISREIGFSSILATHSPFIVGDRDDLLISLDATTNDDSLE
ncbi:AAA family ATPase [Pseudomonas stutzeri]|nr:AAA family ATPase [Stutzerimonas degradans]